MASLQSCATALDATGNLLIADAQASRVRVVAVKNGTFYGQTMIRNDIYTIAGNGTAGYTGDGGPAASAELNQPAGLAVDASGNLVIGDAQADVIRVVAESTGTFYGQAMTAGDIYTVTDQVTLPGGVAAGPAGSLLVADTDNNRIREVAG